MKASTLIWTVLAFIMVVEASDPLKRIRDLVLNPRETLSETAYKPHNWHRNLDSWDNFIKAASPKSTVSSTGPRSTGAPNSNGNPGNSGDPGASNGNGSNENDPDQPQKTAPTVSGTPAALTDGGYIPYTLKPGSSLRYKLSNVSSNATVYVTLSTCSEPYIDEEYDLPSSVAGLQLYASDTNSSFMYYNQTTYGFGNITLHNVSTGEVYVEVTAPNISAAVQSQWSFQLAVSSTRPLDSVNSLPFLYLADTDFANALLVTGNFSEAYPGGPELNDTMFDLYIYQSNGSSTLGLNRRLRNSYCAVVEGPALLNRNNALVSNTTRGYGNHVKGQFMVQGLNKSTAYTGYLALPASALNASLPSGSGQIFQAMNFTTKSETNCQLVFNLDFCSEVAFSVPGNASMFTPQTLGKFYDDLAQQRYANFYKSLQVTNCNATDELRYSILRTCNDCAKSYREWLCAITMPRCTDWSLNESYLFPRRMGQSRNPVIDEQVRPGNYKEILPCADLCYHLVQDCPVGFGFQCPKAGLGLEESYGQYGSDGSVQCNYPGEVYYFQSGASALRPRIWAVLASLFIIWA